MPNGQVTDVADAISFVGRQKVENPFAILAGIFTFAMDAMITIDANQRIVLFNPAAEQAFGYCAGDVLGESLDMLIPGASRASHREHVARFAQTGATHRSMKSPAILKGRRSDGTEFPIEATLCTATADGQNYFTVILRDVSERELAVEELLRHQQIISELSTPVLQVRERLLIVPVIGEIDPQRARQFTEQLLCNIRNRRAKAVVIDLTGVSTVDATVANHLVKTAAAARLLGAHVIVTGISRSIAQMLVQIDADFSQLTTAGDLESGIEAANRILGPAAAAA